MLVSVVEFVLREDDDQQREQDGVLRDLREELRQPQDEKAAVRKNSPLSLLERLHLAAQSLTHADLPHAGDSSGPQRRPTDEQRHEDGGAHQHRPRANKIGERARHQ